MLNRSKASSSSSALCSPSSRSVSLALPSRGSSPSTAPRRSERSRTGTPLLSYPNKPPCTPEEKLQHQLDIDQIPARALVAADDILVPIFNNARLKLRIRKIGKEHSAYEKDPIRGGHFDSNFKSTLDLEYTAQNFTERMKSKSIIKSSKVDQLAFMNLCIRYTKLRYSTRVKVVHVNFKNRIEAGISALARISRGTLISELGGIMSSDIVDDDLDTPPSQQRAQNNNKKPIFECFSVIWCSKGQLGFNVKGDRLLVGPARFVNHSCAPNCKLKPFKGTYAWGIETLREIQAGEEITVSYNQKYFSPGECACTPCQLKLGCALPEAPVETPLSPEQPRKRKREVDDTVDGEPSTKRLRSGH